jgi:acyl carrier protein
MVPCAITFLDRLPLTPNGKVDRRSLPDVTGSANAAQAGSEEEAQSIEGRVAACVASVLGLDRVGLDMNLLEFGANSIDLIKIAVLLEKEFKVRPSIEELYTEPTPRSLAKSYHTCALPEVEQKRSKAIRVYRKAAQSVGCEEGEL